MGKRLLPASPEKTTVRIAWAGDDQYPKTVIVPVPEDESCKGPEELSSVIVITAAQSWGLVVHVVLLTTAFGGGEPETEDMATEAA
jgi:hypothetical protein